MLHEWNLFHGRFFWQQAMEEAAKRAQWRAFLEQLLKYIECRKRGGSMEECMGHPPRLLPFPPPGPFLEEVLANIDPSVQKLFLMTAKEELDEWAKTIEARLARLEEKTP